MRARAVLLAGLSLGAAALLAPSAACAAGWTNSLMWNAGGTARFVAAGAGRNDGTTRLYFANPNNSVYEGTWTGSTWTIVAIGSAPVGVNAAILGNGRNDATQRIYAVSGPDVFEYSWTGSTWTRATAASFSGTNLVKVAVGAGRGDGVNRLFVGDNTAASGPCYEVSFNTVTVSWSTATVGTGAKQSVDVGVGRNDGVGHVYGLQDSGAFTEFSWTGSSWVTTSVGSQGAGGDLRVGDGRGDAVNRIYGTSQNGSIYEFSWTGSTWTSAVLYSTSTPAWGRAHFGTARNDGVVRLFSAIGSGLEEREFTWTGSTWSMVIIGPFGGTTGWDTIVANGRNDGVNRVYGTGNFVYELTYDTVAPAAPAGLGATNPGIGVLLKLSWVANSEGDLKDYGVYRSTTSGALGVKALQVRVAAPGTTHQDAGLVNGTSYYYQLTARDTSGNESGGSPEVFTYPTGGADTTPPAAITNLTAQQGMQVTLAWTAPADNTGVTAYLIRYSTQGAIVNETDWSAATAISSATTGFPVPAAPGMTQTATISGLKPRATHWFAIKAQDAAANVSALDSSSPEPSATSGSFVQDVSLLAGSGQAVAWGDYDNDGDLDLVISAASAPVQTNLYRNDAGRFNKVQSLAGVYAGTVVWGDYDRDGDLDLLVSGWTGSAAVTYVYRNDAGTFNQVQSLTGVYDSFAAWGDLDNDGDLDLAVAGNTGGSRITTVYRNDGGTFVSLQSLTGVSNCGLQWADYDQDGWLDLVVAGETGVGTRATTLYRNTGGALVSTQTLTALSDGAVGWADIDGDGDLDLAYTGFDGAARRLLVYRNDGGTLNQVQDLPGIDNGSGGALGWADADNDGDPDLLIAGSTATAQVTWLYRNDAGTLVLTQALTGINSSSLAWGDFDGDGDVDVYVGGQNVPWLFKSLEADFGNVNSAPASPTGGFGVTYTGPLPSTVTFTWGAGSDGQSGANHLYYQFRAGTTSGQGNLVSGVYGTPLLGSLERPKVSSSQLGQRLTQVANGTTIYWAVRTIDAGLRASAWSVEQSTVIGGSGVDTTPPAVPTGLSATTSGNNIHLAWTANTEADLKDYGVDRGTFTGALGTKAFLTRVLAPGTTHRDASLTPGTTSYYQITARDTANNESGGSVQASAVPGGADTTPPAAPAGFGAANPGLGGALRLSWAANTEGDLKDYRVYRSSTDMNSLNVLKSTHIVVTVAAPGTTHQDAGLTNGTTYYYRITARDTVGNESPLPSDFSAGAWASPTGVGGTGNYLQVSAPVYVTAGGIFIATVTAKTSGGVTLSSATDVITMTTSDLYDAEPAAGALVNGVKAFSLTPVSASTMTVTASASGYTPGTATVIVYPAPLAQLQVLLPGEVAVGGKTSPPAGKTGSPVSQQAGVAFTATVNAVDAWWNVVVGTSPTVTVVTSDPNDNDREPAPAALAAGTRGFLVAPVTLGNVTITATIAGSTVPAATSAAVLITNATPPAAPSGLTATPQEGATIRLAWTVSTSADVTSYRIYYATATTLLNFAAPSAAVAHPTSSYVTPVLTAGQTYSFVVRAVNASGNEETNANMVTAQALSTLAGAVRARVAWPLNGSRVAGARMTVIGEVVAGADRLASIRFDYRPEASSVWTTISPALAGFPNPDGTAPYFIPWDMRSLPLGNYRLRAVAADRDGNLDPAAAEVSITHVAPADVDLEDTVTNRGERQVRQVVRRDQDNRVRVGDERGEVTEVRIPAGALVSTQTVVRVVLNPADASPGQAGLNSLGRTRRISFEDGTTTLRSTFTVRVAFRQDANGNIQGTRASPRALLYCRWNPVLRRYQWVPITAVYNSARKRWEDAQGNETTPAATRYGAPATAGGPALAALAEAASDGTSVVEAETNQDGDYALFIGAAENLDLTLVYPNPFRPNSDATHTDITFANLTEESTIEVLTVAGERVWMKEKVVGRESWPGTNAEGEPVTTGVYVYIITSKEGQKSIGKLAVIR